MRDMVLKMLEETREKHIYRGIAVDFGTGFGEDPELTDCLTISQPVAVGEFPEGTLLHSNRELTDIFFLLPPESINAIQEADGWSSLLRLAAQARENAANLWILTTSAGYLPGHVREKLGVPVLCCNHSYVKASWLDPEKPEEWFPVCARFIIREMMGLFPCRGNIIQVDRANLQSILGVDRRYFLAGGEGIGRNAADHMVEDIIDHSMAGSLPDNLYPADIACLLQIIVGEKVFLSDILEVMNTFEERWRGFRRMDTRLNVVCDKSFPAGYMRGTLIAIS